jgi:hypothetical protein
VKRRQQRLVFRTGNLEQPASGFDVQISRQQGRCDLHRVGGKDFQKRKRHWPGGDRSSRCSPHVFADPGPFGSKLDKGGFDQCGIHAAGSGNKVDKLPPAHRLVVRIAGRLSQDGRQAIVEPHASLTSLRIETRLAVSEPPDRGSGQVLTIPLWHKKRAPAVVPTPSSEVQAMR